MEKAAMWLNEVIDEAWRRNKTEDLMHFETFRRPKHSLAHGTTERLLIVVL